jgi:hypothetical protein
MARILSADWKDEGGEPTLDPEERKIATLLAAFEEVQARHLVLP